MGIAAALLDEHPGFASFGDALVGREEAQRLLSLVEVRLTGAGDGLLAGETVITVTTDDGRVRCEASDLPPGSPQRPPSPAQLIAKLADCGADVPGLLGGLDWGRAARV